MYIVWKSQTAATSRIKRVKIKWRTMKLVIIRFIYFICSKIKNKYTFSILLPVKKQQQQQQKNA